MPEKATIVYDQEAVAAHFGVTARTIRFWVKKGMPHIGKKYDLVACELWLRKNRKNQDGDIKNEEEGKKFHEIRLLRARADLAELKFRETQGELIPRIEVEQLFAARAAVYKQSVLGLEPFILTLLPDEERREKASQVRRRLRDTVENITRPLPEKFHKEIDAGN